MNPQRVWLMFSLLTCSRLWSYLLQFYKWGSLLPLNVSTIFFFSRKFLFFFFFFKLLFIYLTEREREHKQGQEEREKQAPRCAESLTQGLIPGPWDHDLSQRQPLHRLSHPGAPGSFFFHRRCSISQHSRMFWMEDCWGLLHVAIPSSVRHSPDTPLVASIHTAAPHLGSIPPIPRSLTMGSLSLPPASSLAHPDSLGASVLSHCSAFMHSPHAFYLFVLVTLLPEHLVQAAAPFSVPCDTCWLLAALTSRFCNVLLVSTLNSELFEVQNIILLFL